MTDLLAENHDAVVFPGGFGAAKNLLALFDVIILVAMGVAIEIRSTFAVDGSKANVNDQVRRVITSFHTAKKPIGYREERTLSLLYILPKGSAAFLPFSLQKSSQAAPLPLAMTPIRRKPSKKWAASTANDPYTYPFCS